jgi:predicted PurR-regulated permease PerM
MPQEENKFLRFLSEMLRVGVGFIKAQLIFFAINVVLISVFLMIFDVRFAVLIALGISLLDFLPVVGSGLAFLPWIIVCLIIGNNELALRLALLYIGLVVLRQILDPIITGKQIGIRPLLALAASILGVLLLGPVGIIVGPLVAAAVSVIWKLREAKPQGNGTGQGKAE